MVFWLVGGVRFRVFVELWFEFSRIFVCVIFVVYGEVEFFGEGIE